jgi:protein-disulfide isomerase
MRHSLIVCFLLVLAASPTPAPTADELTSAHLLADVDVVVDTAGAQAIGAEDSNLTIIEFFDFQCPYCLMHADQTLPQILEEYVKPGKVRYLFRNFPQNHLHSLAQCAAEAAECAAEHGDYLGIHLHLLKDQQARAIDLGVDPGQFQECLDSGRSAVRVKSDVEQARKLSVPGTPTFYFGSDGYDKSHVRAVKRLLGFQSMEVFKGLIDEFLIQSAARGGNTMPNREQR